MSPIQSSAVCSRSGGNQRCSDVAKLDAPNAQACLHRSFVDPVRCVFTVDDLLNYKWGNSSNNILTC